eukprot:scaffold16458_cov135-Isochrysis_galbana.AAC.1
MHPATVDDVSISLSGIVCDSPSVGVGARRLMRRRNFRAISSIHGGAQDGIGCAAISLSNHLWRSVTPNLARALRFPIPTHSCASCASATLALPHRRLARSKRPIPPVPVALHAAQPVPGAYGVKQPPRRLNRKAHPPCLPHRYRASTPSRPHPLCRLGPRRSGVAKSLAQSRSNNMP